MKTILSVIVSTMLFVTTAVVVIVSNLASQTPIVQDDTTLDDEEPPLLCSSSFGSDQDSIPPLLPEDATTPAGTEKELEFTEPTPAVTVAPTTAATQPTVPATEPAETAPAPTEPEVTAPAPTEPEPTQPTPTEPEVTEAAPTEPEATQPAMTEPMPTQGKKPDKTLPEALSGTTAKPKPHSCSYSVVSRQAPTCTQPGFLLEGCSCGAQRSQTIDKLPHGYIQVKTQASTETVAGYIAYICTGCAASYRETLPLLPPAYQRELCSASLLLQALPHTAYASLMQPVLDRYQAQLTKEESRDAGYLSMAPGQVFSDFLFEFRTVYNYIYELLPITMEQTDSSGSTGVLVWSPAQRYQLLLQCQDQVERTLRQLDITSQTTKWEAVYRINDYLCETKHYVPTNQRNLEDYWDSSTYYSIFSPAANCHNYAIAFQMLCLGAGIECHYYPSTSMNHAWNVVYFGSDTYFWVDVCWNDRRYTLPGGQEVEASVANGLSEAKVRQMRETYLLITTQQLLKDHSL